MTQDSRVALTVDEGRAVLTLNRPPVNALSRDFLQEIRDVVDRCSEDSSVRVLIIVSERPKAFSAGADIEELRGLDAVESTTFSEQGQGLCNVLESVPKPVIAAVRGVAFGGGCELALACDLRIVGNSASFALPEVNLGIIPGWGGTQRLPRLVGKTVGLEMMMMGKPISASRALEVGLVNRVVADDEVLDEALRIGAILAAKPPRSLAIIKRAVSEGSSKLDQGMFILERTLFTQARSSKDAQEGIEAFLEKRKPNFKGQ
ncbi:MAG: enoyl-CoA hydratase-related protein [Chloroflexi bacterium]|nr:enoyl-CoA hydratase-related protein [Chloroflexota bacterium]